jgi:hypothetical protein
LNEIFTHTIIPKRPFLISTPDFVKEKKYDGFVKSRKSPPLSEPEALPPGQKPLWGGA